MKEIKLPPPTSITPVNSGSLPCSYFNNSSYHGKATNFVKGKIEEEINKKLDVQILARSNNSKLCIADLGCATGPNTFTSVHDIIEATKQKHQTQLCHNTTPEFLVFFNDIASNDFNRLFTSLPLESQYFVAGVPGSFYDQLFPHFSLAFAYNSFALNWLYKVPQELLEENFPAWNKGRVRYCNVRKEILKAYATQFAYDAGLFLDARAKELLPGGMLAIVAYGVPHGMPITNIRIALKLDALGSFLMDMAKEGLVRESQVNSFNLPCYFMSSEEMMDVEERNGCFSTELKELTDFPTSDRRTIVAHARATMEGMINKHFGFGNKSIVDDVFERLVQKVSTEYNKCTSTMEKLYY